MKHKENKQQHKKKKKQKENQKEKEKENEKKKQEDNEYNKKRISRNRTPIRCKTESFQKSLLKLRNRPPNHN